LIASGPHQNQPILAAGKALGQAKAALILVHGRGATAESILTLGNELYHDDFAYLAPQAAGNTWYPYSFMAPISDNEPGITSALTAVGQVVEQVVVAGIPHNQIILGGFSQGACVALEFLARNARRYGGALGFSGGLIGPDGSPREYDGALDGTPVFLGCSDVDFHIPKERVELTAEILRKLGGGVTMRFYPGMGHTVNQDEIDFGQQMVANLLADQAGV
jgi:predicted esterase